MIAVISGTTRPDANTLKIARLVEGILRGAGSSVTLLDLGELPPELFHPSAYGRKPVEFEPYQQAVLEAEGILTVTPEYNGSYPGVLKYFIDLVDKAAGFIGLSAGRWGALRSVEHLEMVFQYRQAHLFGRRVFLPGVPGLLDEDGQLNDPELMERLRAMVVGFAGFCRRLGRPDA